MRLTKSVQRCFLAWWPRKKGCVWYPLSTFYESLSFLEPLTVDGFIYIPIQYIYQSNNTLILRSPPTASPSPFYILVARVALLCIRKKPNHGIWCLISNILLFSEEGSHGNLLDSARVMHICCHGGQWYGTYGLHRHGLSYSYEACWILKVSIGAEEMA